MNTRSTKAYTLIEFLFLLAAIVGIGFITIPEISELRSGTKERNRQVVVSKLEGAKNSYDSTANEQARNKFDGSSDETRFELLSPLMGAEGPVEFVRGTGISRLKINRLGENVEIEF
jgi:competence protein ComGC